MTTFFDGPKPRLFAHRGASGEAPENTMDAFQRAVDAGVEYIELDVHASEDGQVMVIHDATIERTTNGLGAVRNYSLAPCNSSTRAIGFRRMRVRPSLPCVGCDYSFTPRSVEGLPTGKIYG